VNGKPVLDADALDALPIPPGVDPARARAVVATTKAFAKIFEESELSANDLYELTIATAIRCALLAGAPETQLRAIFEKYLGAL